MADNEYILFGDIRKHIRKEFENGTRNPTFVDSFDYLMSHHRTHTGQPMAPDFMTWDFDDDTTFTDLIDAMPINASYVLPPVRLADDSHTYYIRTLKKIFISREMPYSVYEPHIDDSFTILYVLRGACDIELESRQYHMDTGELCIISPQVRRAHTIRQEDIVLGIMIDRNLFEPAFLQLLKGNNFLADFFRNTLFRSEKDYMFFMVPPCREIRQIYQHLFQEFARPDKLSDDVSINFLNILFSYIIRSNEATYNYYSHGHTPPAAVAMPYILSYMETHYTDLTLETLAAHFHYEKGYLSKLIHKYTGRTYTEIIYHYRLEKAIQYLLFTNEKIHVIAELTGYASNDHFTRSFRKYTGMSPRDYRKAHAGQSIGQICP